MKSTAILAAAILATTALSGAAYAQSAAPAEVITNTTTRTVRPLAIDGETKELKPAIQRFVERVNMARYALSTKNPKVASEHINEAEKHLNFIKQNSRLEEVTKETVITSGRVTSQTDEKFNSYYVPLEEGPVVVKSIESTGSQTGKTSVNGIAVASADLVYLNVDLTGKEGPEYLAKARAAIKGGDLKAADQALGEMIDRVAKTTVVDALPLEKANDNLRLALKFLQDENYAASRYALDHAKTALKDVQRDSRYNQDDANSVYNKVSQIHDLVLQESPQTAQKARTQIIAVQNKIKDMRS